VVDQAVIEELYDAFGSYQLPAHVGYCTYCDDADYEHALHGDLRSLEPKLVDKYVWDAIHHTGDEQDFKHFLPRVYELLAAGGLPFADPEMAIGRLTMAGWAQWPEAERRPVLRLLDAMWDDAMKLSDPPMDIEELVCGLGLAFEAAPPQFVEWRSDPRPFAKQRLAEFVLVNADSLAHGGLGDAWWSGHQEAVDQVVAWLLAPETLECLETELSSGPGADSIQGAVEVLRLATPSAPS
jgi:hypothetical protein